MELTRRIGDGQMRSMAVEVNCTLLRSAVPLILEDVVGVVYIKTGIVTWLTVHRCIDGINHSMDCLSCQ